MHCLQRRAPPSGGWVLQPIACRFRVSGEHFHGVQGEPAAASNSSFRSTIGRPATSTSALGIRSVRGRRRVAGPPARMAIGSFLAENGSLTEFTELAKFIGSTCPSSLGTWFKQDKIREIIAVISSVPRQQSFGVVQCMGADEKIW